MTRNAKIGVLLAVCAIAVIAAFIMPRIPQWPGYHDFADQRAMAGIPNALNVLSNLPFALVGIVGLLWTLRGNSAQFADRREKTIFAITFCAITATAVGSGYYHLAPDNARLFWDRLPMTVGFTSLTAAMVAERISVGSGSRVLWPLVVAGVASLVWWQWSESVGRGDLRAYGLVQFGSLLVIALLVVIFPARYTRGDILGWVVGLYALAKVLEATDRPVWRATGHVVSGHTLKHLSAAAATACIAWMIHRREVHPHNTPAAAGMTPPKTAAAGPTKL